VSDFDFNPFDPRFYEDPYPSYKVLRDEHPVYQHATPFGRVWPHYWMLSRAADVNDACADWKRFSSAAGTLVDTDASLLPPTMFHMDPPRHDEHRAVLARVLTPSRIASLEPTIRDFATELLRELVDKGGFDVATEFAQLIPTITMCTLMDLPRSEREKFLRWNLDTLGGDDFTSPSALKAWGEMDAYWKDIVRERQANPGTDLVSLIVHTPVQGEPFTLEEISGFCSLLHDASQNTTMNMITNGIISLARYPDQRRRLAAEPEIWPRALEELLRFVSPVQGLARATTCDVELHGVTIPAGDQVLLLYGSADHDERVYPNPDVLDFDRDVKYHWVFGHGIHYCLGNAVARLEVKVAISALLEVAPDFELDEARLVRNQLVPTRGVASAPISFARARV
jgi:cytochrome P450